MVSTIALGADHAGFQVKEALKAWLIEQGYQVVDYGTHSPESVDYPDYAAEVADQKVERGVLVCGTGIGQQKIARAVLRPREVVDAHRLRGGKVALPIQVNVSQRGMATPVLRRGVDEEDFRHLTSGI